MRLFVPLIFCALAACGPLVQIGSKEAPPPVLLRLQADPQPVDAVAVAQPSVILRLTQPQVPAELRGVRLPVERSDTQLQFLAHGQWMEPPAVPLQRLLIQRIAQRTGWLVVDERSADVASDMRLSGRLSAFGLDVRKGAHAHVRFEALVSGPHSAPRAKIFDIALPLSERSADATAAALNQASQQLADQLAQWLSEGQSAPAEPAAVHNH